MSNQFLKLRRSAVQGKIPETSSLDLGELAINTYDGQLFLKKSGSQGEIVTVVGSTGSFTGSFIGNGAGLTDIPASGITGLNLSQIATGSVSASVDVANTAFSVVSASVNFLSISSIGGVSIGNNNEATGLGSHAEGGNNSASGTQAHAEGAETTASGTAAHSEGDSAQATGDYSHAEGYNAISSGRSSHAEGSSTTASGYASHAEGEEAQSIGISSHAEGQNTQAIGNHSHAEGSLTQAIGNQSHAEGDTTKTGITTAYYATSVVNSIIIFSASYGDVSSVFPSGVPYPGLVLLDDTFADNIYGKRIFTISETNYYGSYTEVQLQEPSINTTVAKVAYANDLSLNTGDQIIPGAYSHAEGKSTIAIGNYSHAEGNTTTALGNYQHVQGQYNILLPDESAFIIGNGTDISNKSNLVFASGSSFQVTGSLQVTGSSISLTGGSFSGSGANLYGIPATGITGLNLSQIATGSVTASVSNTDISASFRVTSGSNTLLNVTKDGFVWIGNGSFVNQGYQLDVQGTIRATGDFQFGSQTYAGNVVGIRQETSPSSGNPYYYIYAAGNTQRTGVQITHRSDANGLVVGTSAKNVMLYGVGNPAISFTGGGINVTGNNGSNPNVANIIGTTGTPITNNTAGNSFVIVSKTADYADLSFVGSKSFWIGGNGYPSGNNVTTYYFGGGLDIIDNTQIERSITFNSTFPSSNQADSHGGHFTIAGGKGRGTGSMGDVIFSTANITGSGTALQALADRWWVKGLTGTLSNISNPPSASLYVSGSFVLNGTQFNNTSSLTSAGITTVSQLSTSSYTSCFYNYTVASASNARSGQVMTVWNGSTIRYTEVVTTDIGDTNQVIVSSSLSSGFVRLQVSASAGWTFKNISNLL